MLKHKNKWLAAILAAGMLFNTAAVSAAEANLTTATSQEWYEDKTDYSEYKAVEDLEISLAQSGQGNLLKGTKAINWTMPVGVILSTTQFWLSKNSTIAIGGSVSPANKTVKVGLIKPSGVKVYFNATGGFGHSYTVSNAGFYKVYAANDSNATVTLALAVAYD